MNRGAAKKGFDLGVATIRHAGWWLWWHTDRHASREITELGTVLGPATAEARRPAA
jgi:hypothetical protein